MASQDLNALNIKYDDVLQDYIEEKNKPEGFFYKSRLYYLDKLKTLFIRIAKLERQKSTKLII